MNKNNLTVLLQEEWEGEKIYPASVLSYFFHMRNKQVNAEFSLTENKSLHLPGYSHIKFQDVQAYLNRNQNMILQ